MIIKADAASLCNKSSGKYLPRAVPTKTPINETSASALAAPKKTESGERVCAAKVIAANCVLSPISARNKVPNVVQNAAHLNIVVSGRWSVVSKSWRPITDHRPLTTDYCYNTLVPAMRSSCGVNLNLASCD